MSTKVFNGLLDRHLKLAERIREPGPEEARTDIVRLLVDIDAAIDTGTLVNEEARRMASFRGLWRDHLTTTGAQVSVTTIPPSEVPLSQILKSLSVLQAWAILGVIGTIISGTFAAGNYMGNISSQEKMMKVTGEVENHKLRIETLVQENAQLKELDKSRNILNQERRLAAQIIRVRDSPHDSKLRNELKDIMKQLQKDGFILCDYDARLKRTRIEVSRTQEVWSLPD